MLCCGCVETVLTCNSSRVLGTSVYGPRCTGTTHFGVVDSVNILSTLSNNWMVLGAHVCACSHLRKQPSAQGCVTDPPCTQLLRAYRLTPLLRNATSIQVIILQSHTVARLYVGACVTELLPFLLLCVHGPTVADTTAAVLGRAPFGGHGKRSFVPTVYS